MAVADSAPTRAPAIAWPAPEELRALAPILRLLGGIGAVESVQSVKLATEAGQIDVWVLLRGEAPNDESRIIALEREYRNAVGPHPFELHVVSLDEVDESALPTAETILER
jgi:hypothetical protein